MPETKITPTAADIMTAAPRNCSPFSTVLEAALIFREADCGAVPVLEDGRPVGVVTDRDVALALPDHEADLADTPVSQIMAKDVATVTPETPVDQLAGRFSEFRVRRLLVVDADGRLLGIVAWTDLAPHVPDDVLGRMVGDVVEPR